MKVALSLLMMHGFRYLCKQRQHWSVTRGNDALHLRNNDWPILSTEQSSHGMQFLVYIQGLFKNCSETESLSAFALIQQPKRKEKHSCGWNGLAWQLFSCTNSPALSAFVGHTILRIVKCKAINRYRSRYEVPHWKRVNPDKNVSSIHRSHGNHPDQCTSDWIHLLFIARTFGIGSASHQPDSPSAYVRRPDGRRNHKIDNTDGLLFAITG